MWVGLGVGVVVILGDAGVVPFRGDYVPTSIYHGDALIFKPYSTTVTGANIVAEYTYDDRIDLLNIYGKCEQESTPSVEEPAPIQCVGGTVNVGGKNLVNIPDLGHSAALQYTYLDVCFTQPITISANLSTLLEVGESVYVIQVTRLRGTSYYMGLPGYQAEFTRTISATEENPIVQIIYRTTPQIVSGTISEIQVEFGAEATDYEPYFEPATVTVPPLYGVGDVCDVMWVDRSQRRMWVEHNINPDLLVETAGVDDQTTAILDSSVIEELYYVPLPTYPRYTTLVYQGDNSVIPEMVGVLKQYKEG